MGRTRYFERKCRSTSKHVDSTNFISIFELMAIYDGFTNNPCNTSSTRKISNYDKLTRLHSGRWNPAKLPSKYQSIRYAAAAIIPPVYTSWTRRHASSYGTASSYIPYGAISSHNGHIPNAGEFSSADDSI